VETRTLDPDDLDAALDVRSRSFGILSGDQVTSWKAMTTRAIEAARVLGVYDGAQLVALARINDLTQWWSGRSMPMAGVAGVVVAPEHRGRGVGGQLMSALLDRAHELGYPISALYPATVPVYRATGYEFAGAEYKITVTPDAVRELGRRSTVAITRATPADAADIIRIMNGLHERHRDCGPIGWPESDWVDELEDEDNFCYLAEDGFLMYGWDGSGGLEVQTIVGGSAETLAAFWSILGSGSSVAKSISAVVSPHDPIRWLLRDKGMAFDDPVWWMLRLLDPVAAVDARGFPIGVTADLPIELVDPQVPANTGRFRLTVADGAGGLEPDRTTRPAVELGPNGLAALYAGTPVSTLRRAGLLTGGRSDDDMVLDAAFAARPFMLDYF
jgi:predicted acetyltransferase